MISTSLARPTNAIQVGEIAPDVRLADQYGKSVSLGDFRGQVVVVALFPDEWDPALPQQLAFINEVFAQLLGDFKAVSLARTGVVVNLDMGERGSVQFPVLQDGERNGELARAFGVAGQHAIFVIDRLGVVRWRQLGATSIAPSVEGLLRTLADCPQSPNDAGLSRRDFLVTAAAMAFALTLLPSLGRAAVKEEVSGRSDPATLVLNVNGEDHRLDVEPRVTLLDALRERIGFTGTKKGCDHGQCGACTVLVDGRRVNSCLLLAVMQDGKRITTIEGLGRGEDLHPVQAAFIKHDGFQCGYCTPGQIMSAVACIHEGHATNEDEIKTWMSGNICRCGAYLGIREAIKEARAATAGEHDL